MLKGLVATLSRIAALNKFLSMKRILGSDHDGGKRGGIREDTTFHPQVICTKAQGPPSVLSRNLKLHVSLHCPATQTPQRLGI
jgi:hypothetical protein